MTSSASLASSALPGATNLSSPRKGKFLDIRVDTRPNASPSVAYNSQQNEFLVVGEEWPVGRETAKYEDSGSLRTAP